MNGIAFFVVHGADNNLKSRLPWIETGPHFSDVRGGVWFLMAMVNAGSAEDEVRRQMKTAISRIGLTAFTVLFVTATVRLPAFAEYHAISTDKITYVHGEKIFVNYKNAPGGQRRLDIHCTSGLA
ncbi:MAG: hypothetical protein AB1512_08085 [Thermodesulfobacteriota bacterium]